ncbi:MAG: cell division FtsZ family protein [Bacteroidaceae bacterium]|nr:cell division FtsZ family protein [Bacteroidaceae bacterium]
MKKEEELAPFVFPIEDKSERFFKVIGVGGGGGNVVYHMWEEGVKNVTFMVVDTDSQMLKASMVSNKILLGDGLSTGGDPASGREIAEKSLDAIKAMLAEDTKIVFITAGMGGGTGTGVAPVIARVAKEMGILTIGVVTLPFLMEGKKRIERALKGVNVLKQCVDSLIVVDNERFWEKDQCTKLDWVAGRKKADEVLMIAPKMFAEILTVRGFMGRDFHDVRQMVWESGAAVVSVAKASGEKRVCKAMLDALNSPLIANVDKLKIRRMMFVMYSGTKTPIKMGELRVINDFMEELNDNMEMMWGYYLDEALDDEVKVVMIAMEGDVDEREEGLPVHEYHKLLEKYYHPEECLSVEESVTDEEQEDKKPSMFQIFLEKLKNFAEE